MRIVNVRQLTNLRLSQATWILFLTGLLVRLMLMPIFGSGDLQAVWSFMTLAVTHRDPWLATLQTKMWATSSPFPPPFPYPPMMLYLLWPFRAVDFMADPTMTPGPFGLFLIKLPSLLLDCVVWICLLKLFPSRSRSITTLWWLNPVSIYITYYHGMMDMIPTGLCVLTVYLSSRKRYIFSFIVLGIAAATKTFPLLILPALLLDPGIKLANKLKYAAITLTMYILCLLPYLHSAAYNLTVTNFSEMSRIFALWFPILGDQHIDWFFIGYIIVLLSLVAYGRNGLNITIFGSGALLLIPVIASPPQFGWFLWSLPFMVIFYQSIQNHGYIVFLFCASWLAYYLSYSYSEVFSSWHYLNSSMWSVPQLENTISPTTWSHASDILTTAIWSCCLFFCIHMTKMSCSIRTFNFEKITTSDSRGSQIPAISLTIICISVFGPALFGLILSKYPGAIHPMPFAPYAWILKFMRQDLVFTLVFVTGLTCLLYLILRSSKFMHRPRQTA